MSTHGWLNASLQHNAKEARRRAKNCRKRYTKEPYRLYAEIIAAAYEESARAFESRMVIDAFLAGEVTRG
jgi:F0F1-type ATP synthase membrane subunit b/b'